MTAALWPYRMMVSVALAGQAFAKADWWVVAWCMVIIAYTSFRTVTPVRYLGNIQSLTVVLGEVALHVAAVTFTGFWDSPFVFSLATAVIVAGFARGYAFALRVGVAASLAIGIPFARNYVAQFGLPAERLPNDLTLALGSATYTPLEIAYVERKANKFERFAARFAAKEAGMKAIGTGWRRGVRWKDFEVANLPSGRPTLRLHGVAAQVAEQLGVRNISLSLTHTKETGMAFVILED